MPRFALFFLLLSCCFVSCKLKNKAPLKPKIVAVKDTIEKICRDTNTNTFLDINVDSLYVREKDFGQRDNLKKIFTSLKLDKNQYAQFCEDSKEFVDFSSAKPFLKYFILTKETDSTSTLQYLVFKLSTIEYLIANCTDTSLIQINKTIDNTTLKRNKKNRKIIKPIFCHPIQVYSYEKEIDTVEIKFAAIIQKSISKSFKENKLDTKLIEKLTQTFNGKYNLNTLRKGDTLQFIYEQLSINGQFLESGHTKAVCVKSKKKSIYAVDYFLPEDSSYQYIDEKGKYLKTAFLKSPLQNGGSIVSKYNLHRFHPILQIEKAHLGTDFAAPQGTPILATASGIIEAAQFTQNNGNYVKIKHDKVYETQYLHMSKFARGIRNGMRVQQGQTIGYVGMTGLATGPHVCYRFWKYGEQVDPLKEKLNVIKQIPKKDLSTYLIYFESIKQELNTILVR